MDFVILFEKQEHNYAAWGRPEWEPATNHWGKHRRCAELEADRMNQTGRIGWAPLSRRVRNVCVVECSSAYCRECQAQNGHEYNPEAYEPSRWKPRVAGLMALPDVQRELSRGSARVGSRG